MHIRHLECVDKVGPVDVATYCQFLNQARAAEGRARLVS